MATRLRDHRLGVGRLAAGGPRQADAVLGAERREVHAAHPPPEVARERVRRELHPRRARRAHDEDRLVPQERRHDPERGERVVVGPVQIVDREDERPIEPAPHVAEERGELLEEVDARVPDVARPLFFAPGDGERAEHRERPLEERALGGQPRRAIAVREELADLVDDEVEPPERDRLVLVAAPAERDRPRGGLRGLVDEVLHEGALADPRLPRDEDGREPVPPALAEVLGEARELRRPPDERRAPRRRRLARVRRALRETREDLRPSGAARGLRPEERHAELLEILGDLGRAHARRGRLSLLLLGEDGDHAPRERHGPGERLVPGRRRRRTSRPPRRRRRRGPARGPCTSTSRRARRPTIARASRCRRSRDRRSRRAPTP